MPELDLAFTKQIGLIRFMHVESQTSPVTQARDKKPERSGHNGRNDLPLAIAAMRISPNSPVPIYEQICGALRSAVVAGDLPPGTSMPTSRELALALEVGRNTVVSAYSRLVAEGYFVSNRRRGTHVARALSEVQTFGIAGKRSEHFREEEAQPAARIDISFRAKDILRNPCASDLLERSLHEPDPSLFPRNHLGRLLTEELCRSGASDRVQAYLRFQTAITIYLRLKRGVCCEPAQVLPVTSIESALDLVSRVLIDPGDCVLVEEPTNPAVRQALAASGARIWTLPSDGAGADPAQICSPPPRVLFVSPSVSVPMGSQMTGERRSAILEFARRCSAIIFENDSYWELSYRDDRLRALQGSDRFGQVLFFGSMNETLGPHVRIGYLIVPPEFAEPFSRAAKLTGSGPDAYLLSALARYIEDGQYAVHVRAIRALYAQRTRTAVQTIRNYIRDARPIEPAGGFHVPLLFSDRLDEIAICRRAARLGIPVAPLSSFYHRPSQTKGLVLGLGQVPERGIETVVRRLADVIASRVNDPGHVECDERAVSA